MKNPNMMVVKFARDLKSTSKSECSSQTDFTENLNYSNALQLPECQKITYNKLLQTILPQRGMLIIVNNNDGRMTNEKGTNLSQPLTAKESLDSSTQTYNTSKTEPNVQKCELKNVRNAETQCSNMDYKTVSCHLSMDHGVSIIDVGEDMLEDLPYSTTENTTKLSDDKILEFSTESTESSSSSDKINHGQHYCLHCQQSCQSQRRFHTANNHPSLLQLYPKMQSTQSFMSQRTSTGHCPNCNGSRSSNMQYRMLPHPTAFEPNWNILMFQQQQQQQPQYQYPYQYANYGMPPNQNILHPFMQQQQQGQNAIFCNSNVFD